MNTLQANVEKRVITVNNTHEPLTAGSVGVDSVLIAFDEEWSADNIKEYYCVFSCAGRDIAVQFEIGNAIEIPSPVLCAGTLRLTCVGYNTKGKEVLRTVFMREGVKVYASGDDIAPADYEDVENIVAQAGKKLAELEEEIPVAQDAVDAALKAAQDAKNAEEKADSAAKDAQSALEKTEDAIVRTNTAITNAETATEQANTATTNASNATNDAKDATEKAKQASEDIKAQYSADKEQWDTDVSTAVKRANDAADDTDKRMSAVETKFTEDETKWQATLDENVAEVEKFQTQVNTATETANTAKTTAESASQTATEAKTTAQSAETKAQDASDKADKAKETADANKSDIATLTSDKQDKTDSTLTTTSKQVTGAINELDTSLKEVKETVANMKVYLCKEGEFDADTKIPTLAGQGKVIYLTPASESETNQNYYEWLYIEDSKAFERIGSTDVKLTAIDTATIDAITNGKSKTGEEVATTTGLTYIWSKIKALFAPLVHTHKKADIADFEHTHAKTDITDLTLGESTLTIKQGKTVKGTFGANATSDVEIVLDDNSASIDSLQTRMTSAEGNITTAQTTANNAIKTVTVEYAESTSSTTAPTSGWSTTAPTWSASKYMWQRTTTTTSVGDKKTTITCIQGAKGDKGDTGAQGIQGVQGEKGADGRGISSVTYYYLRSSSSTAPTASNITSTTMPTLTSTYKYLWQKEVITFTDSTTKTTVSLLAVYGDTGATGATGATGRGISSVTRYFARSSSNSNTPSNWYTSMQTLTSTYKYLWSYDLITYTDSTTSSTTKSVIGVYGDTGATTTKVDSGTVLFSASSSSGTTDTSITLSSAINQFTYLEIYTEGLELLKRIFNKTKSNTLYLDINRTVGYPISSSASSVHFYYDRFAFNGTSLTRGGSNFPSKDVLTYFSSSGTTFTYTTSSTVACIPVSYIIGFK